MYADYYKFSGLPFQLTADPRFFFGSSGHQKAMAYLTFGLEQREGFIVITGEIGAGKTTIVGHLFDTLDSNKYVAARVVTTQLGADDLLRLVAAAFGLKQEQADKATLLQRLEHFLIDVHRSGRRALLVIDEAQNLSVGALEELRMLSNFQVRQDTLLQSFLLGQPNFRDTLAQPELEQLRQRVIASYHLGPMTQAETVEYIEHRLRTVGWQGNPRFTPDAYGLIHRESGGVPRRINGLCSRLLLYCFLEGLNEIDGNVVTQVAQELASEMRTQPAPRPAQTAMAQAAVAPQVPAQPPAPVLVQTTLSPEAERRLEELEQKVARHDRVIRQTFAIAADYLDRSRE
ncbi:MAG: XrtA-associated ATPase [Alphaproteobacteria bacterium]|nr:XrtA-associated ATPase [Alphaproteobacteria bacterium]